MPESWNKSTDRMKCLLQGHDWETWTQDNRFFVCKRGGCREWWFSSSSRADVDAVAQNPPRMEKPEGHPARGSDLPSGPRSA